MDKSEFDLIESYFAPLSKGYEEAYSLKNDAALISVHPDHSTVVTMDTLVAGVHFLITDPAADIARKCLRVNLSDIASMGAEAFAYTLSMAYNDDLDSEWVRSFTNGLESDQKRFSLHLIGGDTVKTPGPLTITVTCFGTVPRHQCFKRSTAQPGQDVWVSGNLGDSGAGLKILTGEIDVKNTSFREELIKRYRLPQPRMALGVQLLNQQLTNTAMDVSDGLLADLSHITNSSDVAAILFEENLPLSNAFTNLMIGNADLKTELAVTGGDDYELLFTADRIHRDKITELSNILSLKITRIGEITEGRGVSLIRKNGEEFSITETGWKHF
ncbi:thiamine-phosphate kinase [Kiloniella sp.]|uniref:thiamine-phosphate kinase n=1 Tax=Kiloniella sp. TaxID=1938587 RepID=UPI003B020CD8